MRVPEGSTWFSRLLILIFLVVIPLVLAEEQVVQSGNGIPEAVPNAVDVCAPLDEARRILASLKPHPNAHLIDKVGNLATNTKSWGHSIAFNDDGPLSTTIRLLPRFLKSLTTLPNTFLRSLSSSFHIPGYEQKKAAPKISKARRQKVEVLLGLIKEAEDGGCVAAMSMKGQIRMFPPRGIKQDLEVAHQAFKTVLEYEPDAEAQFYTGFFHATGLGGAKMDQGKATLYYTFSALQGYKPAEMALGYRYWAGIGVKEDCLTALDWYEAAAETGYSHFLSGPPGGLTLPLTATRLSDRHGGIYGPHASWASTGLLANRAAIRASSASARGETEKEILEYYQYHSDRDSLIYTVRLGRLFYLGSVYFVPGGISSGAEGVGEIPQDYKKAKEYFTRVVRNFWERDWEVDTVTVSSKRKMSKEVEDTIREPCMIAAGFLGRMALRGEGGKADYRRAKLWLDRAAELGDRESLNNLGIMYRDGLGVPVDKQKAYAHFQAGAGQDLADSQVNMAKLHLERGETLQASQLIQASVTHGNPYESFHLFARIHSQSARSGRIGMCGVSLAYYKISAEKSSWDNPFLLEADKSHLRGEEGNALLGWWIGAEMGVEIGQNNVAYWLDRYAGGGTKNGRGIWENIGGSLGFKKGRDGDIRGQGKNSGIEWIEKLKMEVKNDVKGGGLKERELGLWVRSAGQDNVDAMVKVGDYFYDGIGLDDPTHRYDKAVTYYQTAASTHTSSMAYWNLGWMYQQGQGVPRDWHLAKRYYDLAEESSLQAELAVTLSVVGLYLKSWWIDFKTGGEIPGLSLFEDLEDEIESKSLWEQIKSLFSPTETLDPELEIDNEIIDTGIDTAEGYNDYSGSGWVQDNNENDVGGPREGVREGRNVRPTGGRDNPRPGHDLGGVGVGGGVNLNDDALDALEDVVESLVIFGLISVLGGLIWLRARWMEGRLPALGEIRLPFGMGNGVIPPPLPLQPVQGYHGQVQIPIQQQQQQQQQQQHQQQQENHQRRQGGEEQVINGEGYQAHIAGESEGERRRREEEEQEEQERIVVEALERERQYGVDGIPVGWEPPIS